MSSHTTPLSVEQITKYLLYNTLTFFKSRLLTLFPLHSSVKCNAVSYRKIPTVSPGLIFEQKAFLLGLFRGSLFSEGLIFGGNFAFQNGLLLTIKTT